MVVILVLFVGAAAWAFVEWIFSDGVMVETGAGCGAGTTCHIVTWGFFSLVPIAAAVVWLLWRLRRVRRRYSKYAHDNPAQLLDTELLSTEIVGRDNLCEILQRDLETRWADDDDRAPADEDSSVWRSWDRLRKRYRRDECRRPIILVGGVGSGKTAALARLTQWLADREAVPVPIRLRAAQTNERLDFLKLAREQFMSVAEVYSAAEADKIWRRLQENDRLVIVADGLEEALTRTEDTRETSIRAAFEKIRRENVALIVSSRPHGAIAHLDAATVKLEPLDIRAALDYIRAGAPENGRHDADTKREKRIVKCAELTEMPLFMHLVRELYDAEGSLERVDARGVDRLGMRVRIIKHWVRLLEAGTIRRDVALSPARRAKVIHELEGIAAFGLMHDKLEVTFDDYTKSRGDEDGSNGATPTGEDVRETLETTTEELRAVAADGERLHLVRARPEGVMFLHSVTQAYLGSRRISEVLSQHRTEEDKVDLLSRQLESSLKKPGRELLMALAMSCSSDDVGARTRAIRILLRNVDDSAETEKAIYTAAAVVAAASASTPRTGTQTTGIEMSGYEKDSKLRRQVILWLTRAECEDAEQQVREASELVASSKGERDRSEARVDLADVRLDDELHAGTRASASSATSASGADSSAMEDKRKRVGAVTIADLTARVRDVRLGVADARAEHAGAHAARAVAATILAEKRLAEARAQPDPPAGSSPQTVVESLSKTAVANLVRAIQDVDHSTTERKKAARDEADAYAAAGASAEDLRATRLAEHAILDVLVADSLLAEAEAEVARAAEQDGRRPEALEPLVADAITYLAYGLDSARDAEALLARPLLAGSSTDEPDERAKAIRDAVMTIVPLHSGEPDTKEALRAEVEIAAEAMLAAADAAVALKADGAKLYDAARVAAARERVRIVREWVTGDGRGGWRRFFDRLEPFLLAAAKATHARHAMTLLANKRGAERDALRTRVLENLAAVSRTVEEARLSENGLPPNLRRATSRTQVLVPLTRMDPTPADTEEGIQFAKLDAVARLYDAAQFVWLWNTCKTDRSDAVVRMAAARKLAGGGRVAFEQVEQDLNLIATTAAECSDDPHGKHAVDSLREIGVEPQRAYELIGWMMPLLYVSIERDDARDPPTHETLLKKWAVRAPETSVMAEMALAEGMRFAANEKRVPHGKGGLFRTTTQELLAGAEFWFSKLVLLQTLTLWMLSHGARDASGSEGGAAQKLREWSNHAGHPLVKEATDLCVEALTERQPANYIWVDERAAVAKLGAGVDAIRLDAKDSPHWVPSAAGWLSLDPRAQRLLADVVVYLNLIDRGDDPDSRDEHLQRSFQGLRKKRRRQQPRQQQQQAPRDQEQERSQRQQPRDGDPSQFQQLPPCLSKRGNRRRLDVNRELDKTKEPREPCPADCNIDLCPYPGLGEVLSRGELGEAFCRHQYELVEKRATKRPEWQREQGVDELREFWRAMERRPRP